MEHENPATGVVGAAVKHCIREIASPPVHVDGASKKAKRNRLERTSGPRRRKHQQSVRAKVLQQVLTVFPCLRPVGVLMSGTPRSLVTSALDALWLPWEMCLLSVIAKAEADLAPPPCCCGLAPTALSQRTPLHAFASCTKEDEAPQTGP